MDAGETPTKKLKTEDTNALEQLKKFTSVVADTSEFNLLKKYGAQDATTNPSLILQAADKPEYAEILAEAIKYGIENFQASKK